MTLKECYAAIDGDYAGVVARFQGERLVMKFALKFLNDKSYETLRTSLQEENYEDAFRAAHTLKGVCQNLGFSKLLSSSDALTEALRGGVSPDVSELFERVKADYEATYAAVGALQAGN